MKIRAVVLDAVGEPVRVDTLDLAEPREGEVLIRMRAAGVCHSDQHVITGRHSADLPCVLGHEGAGEVAAVGSGVERVRSGDRVALNWLPSCKACFYCSRGQEHLCREVVGSLWPGFMTDGSSRLSRNGEMTPFNGAELSRQSKTVKGSYYAETDGGRSIDDLCDAYLEGQLPVDRLISGRYCIDDVQHAIDAMLSGREGRTVITFD